MTRINMGNQDIEGYTGYTITLGYTIHLMSDPEGNSFV